MVQGLILVVEDEPLVRELAQMALKQAGYQVMVAKNGKEALDVIEEASETEVPIDGLLLDAHMPVLDGWQTLKALRQRAIPISVVWTSGLDELEDEQAQSIHVDAFLPKPYTCRLLVDAFRQVMGHDTASCT